jgi:hypothetical protein
MWYRFVSLLLLTFSCQAELSKEQRLADFRQLADVIAKKYAPYEWKRDGVKFDALAIAPWLKRIEDARSDLDYFEICAEYFAKLEDGHTFFILPSTFTASLGFSVDLFEGKVLIDQIDRRRLPEADFPIQIGDEVISFDGKTVDTIMRDFLRFTGEGNPVTARRAVASLLTFRDQSQMPRDSDQEQGRRDQNLQHDVDQDRTPRHLDPVFAACEAAGGHATVRRRSE